MTPFDVLIVGGGPAGTVAAAILARAGATVMLVDRARFPRDKLCGDTINPGTVVALARLGLLADIDARSIPIKGMLVSGPGRVQVRGAYGGGARGRAVLRRDLDAALLDAAARAGARIELETAALEPLVSDDASAPSVRGVLLQTAGRRTPVTARLVIAADGRRSRLGIALGLLAHPKRPRRWAVGAYMDGVAGLSAMGEMHIRRGRYIGVAPLPNGLANVCVVTDDRVALRDPARLLADAVARDWLLDDRFARARRVTPPVVLGPLAVDARTAGAPGLLLAGDAAGFIDPMTGDGIHFAVTGAELAASVALGALAKGTAADAHLRLAAERRRAFRTKWRFNRALRALVAIPPAIDAAGACARIAPALLQRTVAFAGDVPA